MFRRMTRERYLSDAELAAFMRAIRERECSHRDRDHALFALLANTGMRPAEAMGLTRGDVHLEADQPWVRIWRRKKKKLLPEFDDLALTPGVATLMRAHMPSVGASVASPLFEINRRSVQRLFHYYAKAAEIRGRVNLYILRHTAATRLYVKTRDIRLVQAMLGHEKPDMTAIYSHIPDSIMAEMATRIPATL